MQVIETVNETCLPLLMQGLRALSEDLGDPFRLAEDNLAQALFAAPPACHARLVRDGPALLGVALFSPVMSTSLGGVGVYVSDLWIDPAARGGGLGGVLLADVAREGRALWGAGFLKLASYVSNPGAVRFYRRQGFTPVDGEAVLRLTGKAFVQLVSRA